MRNSLVYVLVGTLGVALSAEAAVQKKTAIAPKAALTSKKSAVAKPLPAKTVQTTSSAANLAAPTSAGTTSAPVKEVTKEVATKKFTFTYLNSNAMTLKAISGQKGADSEVVASDKATATYSFSDITSFSVAQPFSHTWFGQSAKNKLENTRLIFVDSKLATLGKDAGVDVFARYDLPTSTASQKASSYGNTLVGAGVTKAFGKFSIHPNLMGRYYFQTYETSSELGEDKLEIQNNNFSFYTNVDMTYQFTEKFSIFFDTKYVNQFFHADAKTKRVAIQKDVLILNPELGFAVSKNFSLALGLYEEINMRGLAAAYVPFAVENDGEAYLSGTVTF